MTAKERLVAVWKHDCVKDGAGESPDGSVKPCEPPCEEPWQVDAPYPHGDTFPTFQEASAYASKIAGGLL